LAPPPPIHFPIQVKDWNHWEFDKKFGRIPKKPSGTKITYHDKKENSLGQKAIINSWSFVLILLFFVRSRLHLYLPAGMLSANFKWDSRVEQLEEIKSMGRLYFSLDSMLL